MVSLAYRCLDDALLIDFLFIAVFRVCFVSIASEEKLEQKPASYIGAL